MTGAALAYLPIPASSRPAPWRVSPRRAYHNPFSRQPSLQPKPRQGVKSLPPQIAPTLPPKTHANAPGLVQVAAQAAMGFTVAAEGGALTSRGGTYVLKDADGVIVRSGRTNDFVRRQAEHARDPALKKYNFEEVHKTDVYAEQRGLEQILHETHSPQLNKIRGVDPNNPKAPTYKSAAEEYLLKYGGR